jgi:predicted phosphodiesterase
MYKISRVIQSTAEQIEIIPTGDWHYGSPNCNIKKLSEMLKYAASAPNCYVVLMGDLWDSIIPSDKRFDPSVDYEQIDEQYEKVRDMVSPIRDKVLCAVTGNHEYKLHTSGHGDLTKRLCKELSIPYGGFSCFLKLKITPKTHAKSLILYIHHGWTAGRRSGGVINSIEGISRHYQADIYLVGHSHHLSSTKQARIGWSGAEDVLFCNTGTFLETATWGNTSYSERAGYPPGRLGVLKVKYYPKKGRYYATE